MSLEVAAFGHNVPGTLFASIETARIYVSTFAEVSWSTGRVVICRALERAVLMEIRR